jgi:hypothetical protein
MTLEGILDIHVHTEPDVRARTCTDLGLAREAKRVGARGVVIKSHHFFTADRAVVARAAVPGVGVWGGVTLNSPVGGLNLAAVDAALKVGAKIVWLPTLFATNHRQREGKVGGVEVVVDGQVLPEARAIFRRVAEADVAIATGHLSALEVRLVAAAAWECGVRKLVVNHPEHDVVGMSIEEQKSLRREFPVWFERCYAQPVGDGRYRSNFEANLRAIEAVGWESTVLATDAGQMENPPWAKCWETMIEAYLREGVSESTLRKLTSENPAAVLGV